ncbi:hypothetical protein RCL1_003915 [Eukaryota sp. TZLM3-RCL]
MINFPVHPIELYGTDSVFFNKLASNNVHEALEFALETTPISDLWNYFLDSGFLSKLNSLDSIPINSLAGFMLPCMFEFIRLNFLGPVSNFSTSFTIPDHSNQLAIDFLTSDTLILTPLLKQPFLLALPYFLTQQILLHNDPSTLHINVLLWCFRSCVVLFRSSPEASPDLLELIDKLIPIISNGIMSFSPLLQVFILLEIVEILQLLNKPVAASSFLDKVQNHLSVELNLTGVIGKRTIFQQISLPQLVVEDQIQSNLSLTELDSIFGKVVDCTKSRQFPEEAIIDGEIRMKSIKIDDGQNVKIFTVDHVIHQLLLLSLLRQVSLSSASDTITTEQQYPWINAVLSTPINWSVHGVALLIKSRLDSSRPKTFEKAGIQIDRLIENTLTFDPKKQLFSQDTTSQHHSDPNDVTLISRLVYFFSLHCISIMDLKKELAFTWAKLGMVSTAQKIFEELKLYDDAVECLLSYSSPSVVIDWIDHVIKVEGKSPRLLVAKGIATNNDDLFLESWEQSRQRHLPALRALVKSLISQNRVDEAIKYLEIIVSKNSYDAKSWYNLGLLRAQSRLFSTARQCFQKAILINDEDFESWAYLAYCWISLEKHDEAMNCIKAALKIRPNSIKLWTNLASVSLECGEFEQVVYCLSTIFDLQSKKETVSVSSFLPLIAKLVEQVVTNPQSNVEFNRQLSILIESIAAKYSCDYRFWGLYVEFFRSLAPFDPVNYDKITTGLMSRIRSITTSQWHNDQNLVEKFLETALDIFNVYIELNSEKSKLIQLRRFIKPLLQQINDEFKNWKEWIEINDRLVDLSVI